MRKELQLDTQQKIFQAAQKVFVRRGLAGARMQEIADEAGINKSLLHYYFRTKEKLFDEIFEEAISLIAPKIVQLMISDLPLTEKIKGFVNEYIDALINHPHIPIFIFHELSTNPQLMTKLILGEGVNPTIFIKQVKAEIKAGTIRDIQAEQLLVNIISLCIFPFIARPVIEGVVFKGNTKAVDTFLKVRKKEIYDFVMHSIKK